MVTKLKRQIWVTFQKHGIHCYPDAPEQVQYLRSPHRHLFQFKVTIDVYHNDREIEFHIFQKEVSGYFESEMDVDHKSCEMLAEELMGFVMSRYPNRDVIVDVSEDGENGATLRMTHV